MTIGGPADCWPWTGTTTENGYGRFYVSAERGHAPAHVIALELETSAPCPPGKQGNHTCDNPPCCNPRHAYWGTQPENCDDMSQRGRRIKGSRHPSAKLTEADIPIIRQRLAAGELQRVIGAEFGVHQVVIGKIANGKTWRHVP